MAVIQTGTDHTLRLTIVDTNGDPIDLNGAEDIKVELFQQRNNVLVSLSLAETTVEITDAVNGRCDGYVNRGELTAVVDGKLYAEVTVDMTNANFEDGFKRSIVSNILIGEIKLSV